MHANAYIDLCISNKKKFLILYIIDLLGARNIYIYTYYEYHRIDQKKTADEMLLPVIFIKTPSETSSSSSSVVVVKKREPSRRPPFSRTPPLLGLRFCCCPTISAAYHVERLLFLLLSVFVTVNAFSIRDFMVNRSGNKRTAAEGGTELVQCPTWHPFQVESLKVI
jgi:hypothetical protein